MPLTVIEGILVALQDGAPRAADRVREESQCSDEDSWNLPSAATFGSGPRKTGTSKCVLRLKVSNTSADRPSPNRPLAYENLSSLSAAPSH